MVIIKKKILMMSSVLLAVCACEKDKAKPRYSHEEILKPNQSYESILQIYAFKDLSSSEIKVTIKDEPEGATFKCLLNNEILENCLSEFSFPIPSEQGVYVLSAAARKNGQTVAVGDTSFSIGNYSSQNSESSTSLDLKYRSDLELEIDPKTKISGESFTNGMAVNMNELQQFRFRFVKQPVCNPIVRCRNLRLNNKFNPICDENLTKKFSSFEMPRGLQYLTVEASCDDRVGKPFSIYWYGVSSGYSFMGLSETIVRNDVEKSTKHIFTLEKLNDCPENLLTFKMRKNSKSTFEVTKDNFIVNPEIGFAILPVCNGKEYSPYVLSSNE